MGTAMVTVNTYQALRTLNVSSESSQDEIRAAYRKMALEHHPDKNRGGDGSEFKKITEAYNHLKNRHNPESSFAAQESGRWDPAQGTQGRSNSARSDTKERFRWGAGPQDGTIPEQDWSTFTRHVEDEDPDFWKEYEKKFWEDYNARVRPDGRNGEFDNAAEPKKQPNIFVDVDKSLCIGCCSCEIVAPGVFEINKQSMMNPKSSVINQRGAGINKIMNAAETCPTKAIRVDDLDSGERMFPH